jgi:hypothetical protein
MSRAQVPTALLAVVAGLAVDGCSSSSEADLCSSADAVRSSVDDLGNVRVLEDGTQALRQAFSEVGDDMDRLVNHARNEFSGRVAGVKSSLADLGTAMDSLGSPPSAASLRAVGTATRAMVEDAGVLVHDVSSSC